MIARVLLISALYWLCFTTAADAFDRRRNLPLNAAVGLADAIVIAHAVRVPDLNVRNNVETADVQIAEAVKGSFEYNELTVQLHPDHLRALGPMEEGEKYILFLREVNSEPFFYEVMLDGTTVHKKKRARDVEVAVTRMPDWSEPQRGLSTLVVPEKFQVGVNENIDLWVGYRNVGHRDVVLSYRSWPLDAHTYWELTIEAEGGEVITPLEHPHVTEADIEDYFSKNGSRFDLTLEPGQSHFFPVPRINSAKPGWGYKERLDFKFYPIAEPGDYKITASGHHLLRNVVTTAEPLRVRVEP